MSENDLSQENFERLLRWLDLDRDQAGLTYVKIRTRLTKIYACRGCGEAAEWLADGNIDRVSTKLKNGQVQEPFIGDKSLYFYSFVNNICHEYFRELERLRNLPPVIQPSPVIDPDEIERLHAHLEKCMDQLDEEDRWLIMEYYRFDKAEKIAHRRRLAEQFGIGLKALRLRVFRIRARLRRCIEDCRGQSPPH